MNLICLFFGHDIRPVVTTSEERVEGNVKTQLQYASPEEIRKMYILKKQTYHGCFCRRCGFDPKKEKT